MESLAFELAIFEPPFENLSVLFGQDTDSVVTPIEKLALVIVAGVVVPVLSLSSLFIWNELTYPSYISSILGDILTLIKTT